MWDRLLGNEWFVRLLSVALALLIYLQVTGQGTGTLSRPLPSVGVQVVGLSGDLWQDSVSPATVAVTVSGPRQTVLGLNPSLVTATVNLSGAKPGRQQYLVSVSIPSGLQLRSVTPSAVTVVTEATAAAQRTVDVTTTGTVAPGYGVISTSSNPSAVIVTGPGSEVAKVTRVIATINVDGASTPVQGSQSLQALDASGQPVPNVTVTPGQVQVTADVKLLYPTSSLPVQVQVQGQPATGYVVGKVTASPSTATVVAPQSVLSGLSGLPAAVDISGKSATVTEQVPIVQPSGVVAVQPSTVSVTVTIVPAPQPSSASSSGSSSTSLSSTSSG